MLNLTEEKKITGIITPLVTPLHADGTLDNEGLGNVVNHVIEGGVKGIFVLGTTGEGPSLTYALRRAVIQETCELVNGRIPVLVGITDSSLGESIELANYSKQVGADAVVSAPPFYYYLSQQELFQYFKVFAEQSPLPLFLYNMPGQTKLTIDVSTITQLADYPNVFGIKDSSANAIYYNTLIERLKEKSGFSIFVGPDEMMASTVLAGGDGGVNSGSNLFPKLYVALFEACQKGDTDRVAQLQSLVIQVSLGIYSGVKSENSFLKGLKSALQAKGICSNHHALPLLRHTDSEYELIENNCLDLDGKIGQVV